MIDVAYAFVLIPLETYSSPIYQHRAASHSGIHSPLYYSMLPLLATSALEKFSSPPHLMLSCFVIPPDAFSALATIRKENKKKKHDRDRRRFALCLGPRNKKRRFQSNRQQFSSSGQMTRKSYSAKAAAPPSHRQRAFIAANICPPVLAITLMSTTNTLFSYFQLRWNQDSIFHHDILCLLRYASTKSFFSQVKTQNFHFMPSQHKPAT